MFTQLLHAVFTDDRMGWLSALASSSCTLERRHDYAHVPLAMASSRAGVEIGPSSKVPFLHRPWRKRTFQKYRDSFRSAKPSAIMVQTALLAKLLASRPQFLASGAAAGGPSRDTVVQSSAVVS